MEQPILILCGDRRLDALCALLQNERLPALRLCDTTDADAVRAARTLVLPVPAVKNGCLFGDAARTPWRQVFALFSPRQRVFGGFSNEQLAFLRQRDIPCFSFLRNEAFTQYNARLTAQGALRLLLEHTEDDLTRQQILITGFGRVAQALASLLVSVGCRCVVAARSDSQRAAAVRRGCEAAPLTALSAVLPKADFICNTVPAPLFSPDLLRQCKKGGAFLELASAPLGAQKEDCLAAGLSYIDGGSLPGRFTPLAAARAMLREVISWTDPSSAMR